MPRKDKKISVEKSREWAKAHPERTKELSHQSYLRNKEKNRAQRLINTKSWYQRHKATYLPKLRAWKQKQAKDLKIELFKLYGSVCICCGLTDIRFLTVDHVKHGRGNKRPKTDRRPLTFYRRLIEQGYSEDYQILCMNCNWAKGVWGKCHHQQDREALVEHRRVVKISETKTTEPTLQ